MSGNEKKKSLAVPEPGLLAIPMMPIEELQKLTKYVNDVKKTLMIKGKDYIIDGDRQFTARSGFAKLHQGFMLSDEQPVIKTIYYDEPQEFEFTHRIRRDLKHEKITTKIYGFEAYVTVTNIRTGRHASGEGVCTVEELHQTHNMTPKWYHRCLATAKTRAWNRAVSNYVGSAEVSAEEMGLTYPGEKPKRASRAPERKEVESEKRDVYPSPEKLETPTWDFADAIAMQGWEEVDGLIVAYLFDMGFSNPENAFEYGHDIAKAWVRNAPGIYFGDAMKEISTVLQIAGFKYHGGEKRWRFAKPEKPSVEKSPEKELVEPVVDDEKLAEEKVDDASSPSEKPKPVILLHPAKPGGVSVAIEPEPSEEKPLVVEDEEPAEDEKEWFEPAEPEEKKSPQGHPRSVDEVTERIVAVFPSWNELFKISEHEDYYRIGRARTLDREIENQLDFLVTEIGGEFDKEKNAWVIPKEAEGLNQSPDQKVKEMSE